MRGNFKQPAFRFRYAMRVSLLCGCLLLTGCSWFGAGTEADSPAVNISPDAQGERSPLGLEVENIVNDGRVLHVVASLTPRVEIPLSTVALRLSGFGGGGVTRQTTKDLRSCLVGRDAAIGELLEAGRKVHAYLALPVPDLTSYQIELLWGGEALALNLPSAKGQAQVIQVKDLKFEGPPECLPGTDCPGELRISATLLNTGQQTVHGLKAMLGFVSGKGELAEGLDLLTTSQQNVASIEMRPLRILPGARQVVRLLAPREVYEKACGMQGQRNLEPRLIIQAVDDAAAKEQ